MPETEKMDRLSRVNAISAQLRRFCLAPFLIALSSPLLCGNTWALPANGVPFNVTEYGALGDGQTKDTYAIQKAIDTCSAAGGGTVYFPAGKYISGSIRLRSYVTLQLDSGATISASTDELDFDPHEKLNYKTDSDRETTYFHYSLIWGEDVRNVAILGQGRIDGNRETRGGPKPIAVKRGRFITIRDIQIVDAPNYCISLLGCDYVNIDGVTIVRAHCDGIDPDCCHHVRISNCHIESWDDAIVLKSSYALGERRATENVTVMNCILSTSCNAFKMGTESGGGFKHVTVSNCVMVSPEDARPTISGIALESVDGAEVDGILISNISMCNVRTPIFLRLGNRGRDMETPVPGSMRNITIGNIEATGASLACSITGLVGHPIRNVTLDNLRIQYAGGGKRELVEKTVPELPKKYPEATMFGELPAYGLYCRHVENLSLRQVQMRCSHIDERPALVCDDIDGLTVDGLAGVNAGLSPLICLWNVRRARVAGSFAPKGTGVFLDVRGEKTAQVLATGNDLIEAVEPFEIAPDVPHGAFRETANRIE